MNVAVHLCLRQVAEALAGRGAVRASVSLLAALAQDALVEGWLSLAAGLLYRLLEVSASLETVWASMTSIAAVLLEAAWLLACGISCSFATMFCLCTMDLQYDSAHVSAAP